MADQFIERETTFKEPIQLNTGTTPQFNGEIGYDNATGFLLRHNDANVVLSGSSVSGPGSAVTDNALVRWDGVGGNTTQNSLVTVSDTGNISSPGIIQGGASVSTDYLLSLGNGANQTILSGTNQTGILVNLEANESATAQSNGMLLIVKTKDEAFTCAQASGIKANAWTKGTASTITHGQWLHLGASITATNTAKITDNTSYTGDYFINQSSTLANQLDGTVFVLANLPTSDPTNTGQLWNNSGVLTVSA